MFPKEVQAGGKMFFHGLFGGRKRWCGGQAETQAVARPLSECCACSRVKVCRISGDRAACGRMASMGLLPGAEMELLCPGRGRRRQCMVKVNGGTLSLDELTAASIFVEPT